MTWCYKEMVTESVPQIKKGEIETESPIYIVTTGTGRQGKAHLLNEKGESLCGKEGRNCKTVDAETVEIYYEKCQRCLKLFNER